MSLLTCRKCRVETTVDAFYASPSSKSGYRSECKRCSIASARQWSIDHPERATANAVKSHSKPESKAKQAQWMAEHKDYVRECLYRWRRDNPTKVSAIAKKSRIKNMSKVLIRNREREIAEVTQMPAWADRGKIKDIYLEAQRLTRETGIRYEVDHIYPLRGKLVCGLHVENNLRIITGTENRRKFNKMPEAFTC